MLRREPTLDEGDDAGGAWRTEVLDTGEVLIFKRGTLRLPNGDEYVGEFLNNRRHGRGTFRRANGDVYQGACADGEPSGTVGALTRIS